MTISAATRVPGQLLLDDGTSYHGELLTTGEPVTGEVVFSTAMAGYPETLTDPSFAGQILVNTYPLAGNYGVELPAGGDLALPMQSGRIQVEGFVVSQVPEGHNHHAASISFSEWLVRQDVPLLTGIDTRALTMRLRERGTMRGWMGPAALGPEELQRQARESESPDAIFRRVAGDSVRQYGSGGPNVLLIDVGAKDGIVHSLLKREFSVTRAPWHADIAALARQAQGIVLSNGPGDPADLDGLAQTLRALLGSFQGPVFGVCLGHQLLARSLGLGTYKLKYGHRGINQPVQDAVSKRCLITSQNHGYAVDVSGLPSNCIEWFRNLNDGTNEGIRLTDRPIYSVQFHPEAMPGPADSAYLFDEFRRDVEARRIAGGAR